MIPYTTRGRIARLRGKELGADNEDGVVSDWRRVNILVSMEGIVLIKHPSVWRERNKSVARTVAESETSDYGNIISRRNNWLSLVEG